MILPSAWRNRSSKVRILTITGLTPVPCRSQPSACMSTMMRAELRGESSVVGSDIRTSKIIDCSLPGRNRLRQVTLIEKSLRRIRDIDLFQERGDIFLFKPDVEIRRVIIQRLSLDA